LALTDGGQVSEAPRVLTERDRAIVEWIGRLGAASAEDVMARFGMGRSQAYERLRALVVADLLAVRRLVHGQPTLYVATRDGLAWGGLHEFDVCRVSVALTRHWALCARLAVVLERIEPDVAVWGERELRAAELDACSAIASAQLERLPDGRARLRRPDLVLVPGEHGRRPVAVEVELSVKGARRLEAICRAWARCRLVESVRYYASPLASHAVARAVQRVDARDVIEIHLLDEALEGSDVRFAA
jgi:hypothetical protein